MIILRRGFALALVLLTVLLTTATLARAFELTEARPYVAVNIASYHHDAAQNFEETNPGLGLGFTLPVNTSGAEVAAEVGRYRNSVGGQSTYATAALDAPVAALGHSTQIRLGAFGGMAHYKNASTKFAGGGVPMIGDWVVVGGAQATLRINDSYDIRARVLPAGKAAQALFTLQVAARF